MKEKKQFQHCFGQKVRVVRTVKNLTLEELALEAGLAYSQVSRIERGKINTTVYTAYILSKVLKVPASDFFDISDID